MSETTARQRLEAAERQYAETFEKHLDNGVEFTSRNVYIDPEVEIAPGAVILPGCILKGNTKIAAGCVIGPQYPAGEHHGGGRLHRQCQPVL